MAITIPRLLVMTVAPLLCANPSWPLLADDSPFIYGVRPNIAPSSVTDPESWKEDIAALPAWPQEADLVELNLDGPRSPFRYFIDTRTLGVGDDRVVRYTLVAESATGARNISVEGVRCTPRGAYKVFAYGSAGRFVAFENPQWQPIVSSAAEPWRDTLWRYHLCNVRDFGVSRSRRTIIQSLKGQTTLTGGFLGD